MILSCVFNRIRNYVYIYVFLVSSQRLKTYNLQLTTYNTQHHPIP